ncbi:hypothetical protein BDY19DRAFT_998343 [Irpex rosettiformis]|uniref:Uncharacterized protein n=1 Tax=Irpex rosettiformis TaxID=378272 RepID=A0ACB8TNX1_9APHY|nr:hypothetical protein BDY19DRAFT_998343 [Irpex rosettiformis]
MAIMITVAVYGVKLFDSSPSLLLSIIISSMRVRCTKSAKSLREAEDPNGTAHIYLPRTYALPSLRWVTRYHHRFSIQ